MGVVRSFVSPARSLRINRGMVFLTVSLALTMMTVDSTIVATALDALQRGLHTTVNWAAWTLTAYSFGFVLMLPITGKLSERYGRRRVFLASTVIFTGASLCCGLVSNIFVLIVLRALQAGGGAGFTPSATGIVVDYFGDMRDRAVSLFGSIIPVGAMIGPIFGGLFVTYWSWRGVFFVNVPLGLLVVIFSLRYVPRDPERSGSPRQGMDAAGMALLGVGLIVGMVAIGMLGEKGVGARSVEFLAPLAISALALWAFFHHIHRTSEPFIAPRMIHGRDFGAVNFFNGLYGGITLGVVALIPLYAINRYHIGVLASGTLLTAEGIAVIGSTIIAALALRRTGHRPPLYAGSALLIVGLLFLALGPRSHISPYVWVAIGACIVGIGYGTTNPAARNAGLQLAPEHSSTLAALRTMCLYLGSIITISIATAVISSIDDHGIGEAWFFVVAAGLLLIALPSIRRVPEHHGAW